MPTMPQDPKPDGWDPTNEFDGHVTPEDHSGCTKVTVTLCADDWLIASCILDGYAQKYPASNLGRSSGLIDRYIHKALGF